MADGFGGHERGKSNRSEGNWGTVETALGRKPVKLALVNKLDGQVEETFSTEETYGLDHTDFLSDGGLDRYESGESMLLSFECDRNTGRVFAFPLGGETPRDITEPIRRHLWAQVEPLHAECRLRRQR